MRILYVTRIVPFQPHGGVLQRGFNLRREAAKLRRSESDSAVRARVEERYYR